MISLCLLGRDVSTARLSFCAVCPSPTPAVGLCLREGVHGVPLAAGYAVGVKGFRVKRIPPGASALRSSG